jgi:hypothetical protein
VSTELDAAQVIALLGFGPGSREATYVEELADEPPAGLVPLSSRQAAELLDQLKVSPAEAADVVSTLPDPERTPAWWWCCERAAGRLLRAMGDPDARRGTWPSFEGPDHDLARRCHFVHVALLVAPATVSYFEGLGVPPGLSWSALDDVARHMAIHRRVFGLTGMDAAWWVTLCLRGEMVDLGRLQYNRFNLEVSEESPVWYLPEEQEKRGEGFRKGDPSVGVHIPESGPLLPALVSESLEMAGEFFARYFPVSQRRVATCMSWLLDPQLAEYLPEGSNIVSFQRRFELVPGGYLGDEDVLQFVFRSPAGVDLETLSQKTTLERAVVTHLRAGRHWQVPTGWLDLPAA